MLYQQFQADENLEKNGVDLHYGFLKNEDGTPDTEKPVMIKVARAGGANVQYLKRLEAVLKPYRRQIQTETLDSKLGDQLLLQVFAETVVLGWQNVVGRDGKPMEFNKANVIKLFTDLPDLYKNVSEAANNASLYRAEVAEADAGN